MLGEDEYWAIVDKNGKLYMKCPEIDSSPLYLGKEKALAESILNIEAISRVNDMFDELNPKVAKVVLHLVDSE